MGVTVPCEACSEPVGPSDEHCDACGAAVSRKMKDRLFVAQLRAREEIVDRARDGAKTDGQVTKAANMIGILAILFVVGGAIMYLLQQHRLVLLINGSLAVVMGALWMWAKSAPLQAIFAAISIFVVVQAVGAVLDPWSLLQGIVIKLIAVVGLARGLKAALDARAAQRPAAAGEGVDHDRRDEGARVLRVQGGEPPDRALLSPLRQAAPGRSSTARGCHPGCGCRPRVAPRSSRERFLARGPTGLRHHGLARRREPLRDDRAPLDGRRAPRRRYDALRGVRPRVLRRVGSSRPRAGPALSPVAARRAAEVGRDMSRAPSGGEEGA